MSEVKPIDMKEIGFFPSPSLDELKSVTNQAQIIECYVYHELVEQRKHFKLPKNDADFNKKFAEYNEKYTQYGDDAAFYYFMERDKKPVCLLTKFKGPISELNNFIAGVTIDDGQGIRAAIPAHPRTTIAAQPGAYGNPPIYESDKSRVIATIKALDRFSEIREMPSWDKLLEAVRKSEQDRKRS